MVALFFLLWILLCGKLSLSVCLSGAAASALAYLFSRQVLGYRLRAELRNLGKLGGLLRYLGSLIWEMLRAGAAVMRLVYARGRELRPVLVRFDTALESEAARSLLANSITLTAGTITVRDEDGHLLVHALDRSLAEGIEHSPFEKRLLRLEEKTR